MGSWGFLCESPLSSTSRIGWGSRSDVFGEGRALRGWLIGSRGSWLGAASWQSEGSLGSRRVGDREGGVCGEGLVSVSEMASAVSACGDGGGNGYGFC
ncbi:hypothetical protein ACFX2C_040464 [Malus domestica]